MLGYHLRRVPQFWGLNSRGKVRAKEINNSEDLTALNEEAEETYVYYMIAPWWAKQKTPNCYLMQF
jgi:hypothetical protein